jgi:hypothetical protein
LNAGSRGWGLRVVCRTVSVLGVLVLGAGCHARRPGDDPTLLERISRAGHSNVAPPKPGALAERGRVEITDECAKQSYETARKGLIVSETGLHEDVFTLRDRVSYGAIGYDLDEALRLEAVLRAEAKIGEHSTEQADCIQEFAEHLETVSDQLVEADERMKELDASAFQDSAKEAEEQAQKQLRQTDKITEPKEQPPENY